MLTHHTYSAKDKAILEEAYAANPKPDKTARLAIVNRVSLNEKEVQVGIPRRRAPQNMLGDGANWPRKSDHC